MPRPSGSILPLWLTKGFHLLPGRIPETGMTAQEHLGNVLRGLAVCQKTVASLRARALRYAFSYRFHLEITQWLLSDFIMNG